jgi:hypothetical protein
MGMAFKPCGRGLRQGRVYGPRLAAAQTMTRFCLILIAITAATSPALAQSRAQPAPPQAPREVSSVRSDGAVYQGVRQRPQRERARTSDIVTTRRLLGQPGQWRNAIEPVDGGNRVAPTDGRGDSTTTEPVFIDALVPVKPTRNRPPAQPDGQVRARQ